MDYFLYYQYFITAILLLILVNFIINNIAYRCPSDYSLSKKTLKENPLVSVLIPARDEEDNIGRCIRSLIKQDYENIEILTLDDNSTDRTAAIAGRWAKRDKRVRLIKGKPLEKGWKGKSYACHQLSKEAKGKYLVFTDADTLHFPDSVSSSVAALEANGLDAMSAFPRQIMVTIHERMIIIFINIAVLALLPIYLMRRIKNPSLVIANGQFLLLKRKVYDSIGGHMSTRKEIIEDVAMARQVKKHGYKFMIFDGRRSIHCRMYKGFEGVFRGFSKFIFAAMNYSVMRLIAVIIGVLTFFMMPFFYLPLGLYIFDWPTMVNICLAVQICVVLLIRIVMTFRFRSRLMDIFLQPFSMLYIIIPAVDSVLKAKYGKGIYWKNRYYDIRDAEEKNSEPDI